MQIDNPKIKFYVFPVIKFKSDKILVSDKNNSKKVYIESFYTKFRILPLLSGRLHINTISAKNLNLGFKIKQTIELDKNLFKNLEKTRVTCDCVNIDNFEISLSKVSDNHPIKYKGKNFIVQNKNRFFKFKADSTITTTDTVSKILINMLLPKNSDITKSVFEIEISNLDIAPLGNFFKNYLPEYIENLKGLINIKADKDILNAEFKNVAIVMKDKDLSITLPKLLKLNSNFTIRKDLIQINSMNLVSERINLNLNGKIKDYFGKNPPLVNINTIINKSKVEDFIEMLPPFEVEEFDTFKLKKYKFYGDTIGNLTIKGRFPEPEITGNVFIDNGILIKPLPNTNKGASIKLKFTGKYVNYDVSVPAGFSEKVWVKGTQELYNIKYGDLTVKSTKSVSLPVAEFVVNPLHEILNFVIGPVPILDVYDGTGNIDIAVKGNRKNPHVWGYLNFDNTSVKFIEMPDLKLVNADAVLKFYDKNAEFETKSGTVNGKVFNIKGVCDLSGKLDFNVTSQDQPTSMLYSALKTADLLGDMRKMIPPVDKITGNTDLNLKIYGAVKEIEDLEINKNVFAKGTVKLKGNEASLGNITMDDLNGDILIDGNSTETSLTAKIDKMPLYLYAKLKNDIGSIKFDIPKLNPNFIFEDTNLREKEYLPYISANAEYNGNINDIEYKNLKLNAKIIGSSPKSCLKYTSGEIIIKNNKADIKNLKAALKDSENSIFADLKISDTFSKKPKVTGVYKVNLPETVKLNPFLTEKFMPEAVRNVQFISGGINFNGKVAESKMTADLNLKDLEAAYLPLELPVKVLNGKIKIRNNNILFDKINLLADNMPILADGEIRDILGKKYVDIYINSKPKQEFIDKYLNKKIIYPLKIKGDIIYSTTIKGTPENCDIKAEVNMKKDSSIYYYGAILGDIENAIVINLDTHISGRNNIYIKDFLYDKLIESQNGREKRFNMIKAQGGIEFFENKNIGFNNFKIKTSMPADAKIFNIIFGKPNIKQGRFTSNLRINGKLTNPRILGDFHIFETDIPFLDTTMKNIELLFKDKTIDITSKGEVFGNDISIEGVLQNKLSGVYYIDSATIYAKDMDLNRIVSKLKEMEMEQHSKPEQNFAFDINSIIAKNVKLKADTVELRNIHADDFKAEVALNKDGIFDMKNFGFSIAQGRLNGNYQYNIKTNNIKLDLQGEKINANDITLALFDLRNQIYGELTGNINMSCNGESFDKCMQTLNGSTIFNVKDGRMPKLGSLEYLLKAGNLVKGGLTGLSINSIIDLISPLKTGNFSDIFGLVTINKGIADDIEITTKGKDLSLFISGIYNFYTSDAEMEVLGLLSRKITTLFGPIGNISVNTLFNIIPGVDLTKDSLVLDKINKIPGIELSGKAYRKFVAEIKGNINGENYVTNFSWIN